MEVDLYAEDMKPTVGEARLAHHITVKIPIKGYRAIEVSVGSSGYVEITSVSSNVFGFVEIEHDPPDDIVDAARQYLLEWELVWWRSIGEGQSELFATKNLDPEWGIS